MPATVRQIEANRRNARRSTGPRTPEGKDRAKYNAFKHGLTAATVLPHENLVAFHEIRAALIDTWQPVGAQEMLEVDNLVMGWWCMQRSSRFERRLFELELQHMKALGNVLNKPHPDDDGGIVASFHNPDTQAAMQLLFRYDSRAASKYYRAMDHLMKLQARRKREESSGQPCRPAAPAMEEGVEKKVVELKLASFGGAQNGMSSSVTPGSNPPAPEPVAAAPGGFCGREDRGMDTGCP